MSVYVDGAENAFARMKMCHMVADTRDELLAMADAVGVQRKWLQNAGKPSEHFDVCKSKRVLAIGHGALEVTGRELARIIGTKRAAASGPVKEGT